MSYLYLGIRYLISEKKRAVLTILGVALVAGVQFGLMWAAFSLIELEVEDLRNNTGFDVAVYGFDEELAKKLIEDNRVRAVRVGISPSISYYSNLEGESIDAQKWNTDKITLIQLYHSGEMKNYAQTLQQTYGVETIWNQSYLDESFMEPLLHLIGALLCFIFSIAGVAMVRNSIQISTMKQIRDYGNLRCIGATKKQLRAILFLQGFLESTIGLVFGMVLALIFTGIFNSLLRNVDALANFADRENDIFQIKVIAAPVLYIPLAFYFDLFFVLKENLKSVYGMSPAQAISGQYRFLNKKIKKRKTEFIRKLLGVEGEYAYKNLMRSPARVWKNVGILSIAVAFITSTLMMLAGHFNALLQMEKQYPYYQISVGANQSNQLFKDVSLESSILSVSDPELFPEAELKKLIQSRCVTKSAPLYQEHLLTAERVADHLNPEPLEHSLPGRLMINDKYLENVKLQNSWDFRGFSDEEKEQYKDCLLEGTMDVSDHGIVIIDGISSDYYRENEDTYDPFYNSFTFYEDVTDFNLGDHIRVIDPIWLKAELDTWIESTYTDEALMTRLYYEANPEEDPGVEIDHFNYRNFQRSICVEEYQTLYEKALAEGKYEDFEVEGILSKDPLYESSFSPAVLLLPMDRYFSLTGKNEISGITALNYHVEHPLLFAGEYIFQTYRTFLTSDYLQIWDLTFCSFTYCIVSWADVCLSMMFPLLIVLAVLALFLILAFFNIRNATKNSIFLRRKEFAQLYVIGCTTKSLARMLRYEGVISGSLAIIFGCILSVPSILLLKINYRDFLANAEMSITWWLYPVALGAASLFIIGFYAFSVGRQSKQMKITPATDLTTAGE